MLDQPLPQALEGLEPELLWRVFDQICQIPRRSLNEEGVRQWLESLAAESEGWRAQRDDAGNIVLYVPGNGAGRNSAPLAIQGHMDMVCVKRPEIEHDFDRDPIRLDRRVITHGDARRDALVAIGTTLGSDNGIGLSAGLALALDENVDRPPLQLVFTADEERGMSGAEGLDGSLITARRLLNLDAEEHGSVYLACAGGRDLRARWSIEREPPVNDEVPLIVSIGGLRGGHSGVDIHLGRANAVVTLARILLHPDVDLDGVRLGSIDGGAAPNAIPRRARALLWVAQSRSENLAEELMSVASAFYEQLDPSDSAFRIEIEFGDEEEISASTDRHPLPTDIGRCVLKAITALPNGVVAMSDVSDDVESSSNIGVVTTAVDQIELIVMSRSSKHGVIETIQARMERSLEAAGAAVLLENGYPGWEASADDPLIEQTIETFETLFGRPPEVKTIHGGLECGFIADRLPEMKMVAFGPEIVHAHTPEEALILDTVGPFWRFVTQLVHDLC
jgi:dipeptidase D